MLKHKQNYKIKYVEHKLLKKNIQREEMNNKKKGEEENWLDKDSIGVL